MNEFKKISGDKYISNFFYNMARRKNIEVRIQHQMKQVNAVMFFIPARGNKPSIKLENECEKINSLDRIKITIHDMENIYVFQSVVHNVTGDIFQIEFPSEIYTSFRRVMPRYKITVEDSIKIYIQKKYCFDIVDLSTMGCAFKSSVNIFENGQIIRDIVIYINNDYKIYVDACIQNCRQVSSTECIYGLQYTFMDWSDYQELMRFIFNKTNPRLYPTGEVPIHEVYELYKESGFFDLGLTDNVNKLFEKMYIQSERLKNKMLLYSGFFYMKSNVPVSFGNVIRSYNNTFVGQQPVSLKECKLDPRIQASVYKGLADFLLMHPYFNNYISYIVYDFEWQKEFFLGIDEIIGNKEKFLFDHLQMFHCKAENITAEEDSEYTCNVLEEPFEFYDYCSRNLSPIEVKSYEYNALQFDLLPLRQIYESADLVAGRRVFSIKKSSFVIAYAVAEAYTEGLKLYNIMDNCRVYFTRIGVNLQSILKCMLPALKDFYQRYDKDEFTVLLKAWDQVTRDIDIPGMEYKLRIGRVLISKTGMIEFKKLLSEDIIQYSRYYPLTYPQQGVWNVERVFPGTSFGNIASTIDILDKELDTLKLQEAINLLLRKNDGLRLRFIKQNEQVRQYFSKYERVKIGFYSFDGERAEEKFNNWIGNRTKEAFKIIDNDLFYFAIFRINNSKWGVYFKTHHIISDGWTGTMIINEIMEYYSILKSEGTISLKQKPSFVDAIQKEREYIDSSKFISSKAFWEKQFESVPELIYLKHKKGMFHSTAANRKTFCLSGEMTEELHNFCKAAGYSVFSVFLSILSIYLSRISLKRDMVIGTPVLNRTNKKQKEMLGMFISIVPVRIQVDMTKDYVTFVRELSSHWMRVLKHQRYPFELIQQYYRETHRTTDGIYDICLSFQNAKHEFSPGAVPYHDKWHFSGAQTESLCIHISDRENQGRYMIDFDYLVDSFDSNEIDRMFDHIHHMLKDAIIAPHKKLHELSVLSEAEEKQILHVFNNTKTGYPRNKSIIQLFEEQAELNPLNTAVSYEGKELTYRRLNEMANQLSYKLEAHGIIPGDTVGISVSKSIETIIGILGILKAGAVYLPIELQYPAERKMYMLKDCNAGLLLIDTDNKEQYQDIETVNIKDVSIYEGAASNHGVTGSPESPAYIMYTSGTTGNPKGVVITHKSIIRLVKKTGYIDIKKHDRILQTGAISFDASTFEIWGALLNGAALYIVDENSILDANRLKDVITKSKITILWLTSPLFNQLVSQREDLFIGINTLIVGGDVLSPKMINIVNEKSDIRIINGYGPTENTTFSTCFSIEKEYEDSIPIGKPISNSTAYIVDDYYNLQPVGALGELLVGGDGLAKGYLNRDELNREKFIITEFSGERVYKTGDLARWLPDGNIEFVGRKDSQVKIRGFRIEPGEIEAKLLEQEGIKEACVIDRIDSGGNKYLCAYLVCDDEFDVSMLRSHMQTELPKHMIPAYFINTDSLPLNKNGKVDRTMLPEPDPDSMTGTVYQPPQSSLEKKLAEIFTKVLNISKCGIDDNFFEMGGDSLKAVTFASLVQKELNLDFPVGTLFQCQTVRGLSKSVSSSGKKIFCSIKKLEKRESYPVSSAQKRMYMLGRMEPEQVNYNIPGILKFDGHLDKERLKLALDTIVRRHEALRTSFEIINGEIVQRINGYAESELECICCDETGMEGICKRFIRAFDLSRAPLVRFLLIELDIGRHVLLFDMHHIVSDGTSLGIFVKELIYLYRGRSVPRLEITYKDYAVWQNSLLKSEAIRKQRDYWVNLYEGSIPTLNMPADYTRPSQQSFEGERLCFFMDKQMLDGIDRLAAKTGATRFMLLLAAYNVLLHRYTGQEDIIVGTPVAGRTHVETHNLIGMFVNTLALRHHPSAKKTFSGFLSELRENTIRAFENQDYQFEELINNIGVNRDVSRNPLFDTMFVMQNFTMPAMETDELNISIHPLEFKTSKVDFTLQAAEKGNGIEFELEYCTRLFKKDTMERFARHYTNVLRHITSEPDVLIADINIISEEELDVLAGFNNTRKDYPRDMTINQLFEAQVIRTPDKTAVQFEDRELTYFELNQKANQLARVLRDKGVMADSIVGIMVHRSIEMIIGIMGILKAGGAYLPIDPEYPADRIKYITENSGVSLILVQERFLGRVSIDEINLDDDKIYNGKASNLETVNLPDNLAYVIYTSGSTGFPKGVMIEHRALVNRLDWMQMKYPISGDDTILQKTPYTFDVSVWELLWWSVTGAKVCMLSPFGERDPERIISAIETFGITTMHFVPSMLALFLEYIDKKRDWERLRSLRQVFSSGEAISPEQANKFNREIYNKFGTRLHNLYGPTEAAIDVTYFDCSGNEDHAKIPIGRPINNIRLYILNRSGRIQPIGVPGELHIAGDGLARGYLNNPDLTNEKFIKNPFDSEGRLYKTGDLARWMPDGDIEFLGRMDHQVKIRGFRIELGEIEYQLLKIQGIDKAVVLDRIVDGKKVLCAYYAGEEIPVDKLRCILLKVLPDYMVPQYYTILESIPLTHNGKADRNALPEPQKMSDSAGKVLSRPSNETEKKLIMLWKEVLGIDRISPDDNFFDLGGDSFAAIRVLSAAFAYEWNLEIQDFYRCKTLRELARKIQRGNMAFSAPGVRKAGKGKRGQFNKIKLSGEKAVVNNLLLTGATGFLGIHILDYLISSTDASVYCLVRGIDKNEAETRLIGLLDFYFPNKYQNGLSDRIFVLNGDVIQNDLGLSGKEYKKLVGAIDTVIHAAAIVKHYGNYQDFEKTNVQGTKEIIRFIKSSSSRLGFISTISVKGDYVNECSEKVLFTEDDFDIGQNYQDNVYIRSKFEAEKLVFEAMDEGIKAAVYRVGNLTGRYCDGFFQINIKENSFYNSIKSILELGVLPKSMEEKNIDLTPVDICSKAVVELTRTIEADSRVFHLYNNNNIYLKYFVELFESLLTNVKIVEDDKFNAYLCRISGDKDRQRVLDGIINELNTKKHSGQVIPVCSNTLDYLRQLGIFWPEVEKAYTDKLFKTMIDTGFIDAG